MRFTTALALLATSSYALDVAENTSGALMARDCPSGKKSCGKSCIPSSAACCGDDGILSQYCSDGMVCNNQSDAPTVWWCCPKSKSKCSIVDSNRSFPEFGVPGADGDSGSGSGSSGSGSSGSGSGSSGSGSGSSGSGSGSSGSGSSGSGSGSGDDSGGSSSSGSSSGSGNSNGNSNSNNDQPKGSKNAAARDGASVAAVALAAAVVMAF